MRHRIHHVFLRRQASEAVVVIAFEPPSMCILNGTSGNCMSSSIRARFALMNRMSL
jgi:hypothetical protein